MQGLLLNRSLPATTLVHWEMMGLVGSVIDASIGWLVESILRSFFTGQMEVWTCEVGLTEAVEKLKFEVMNVEMLLAAAGHAASEGIKIENKTLTQSLDDLRDLLYDADDVMDELDYYRLQEQIEKGAGLLAVLHSCSTHVFSSLLLYWCS